MALSCRPVVRLPKIKGDTHPMQGFISLVVTAATVTGKSVKEEGCVSPREDVI